MDTIIFGVLVAQNKTNFFYCVLFFSFLNVVALLRACVEKGGTTGVLD